MLKISWKQQLMCTAIEVLGLIGVVAGVFVAAFGKSIIVFLAGLLLWGAGIILDDRMYRCPHCGHYLKERNHRGLPSEHVFDNCPGCGWKVQIEVE